MPTPTGRASRKRYCTVACRKAAWRERHRHDPAHAATVPHGVPGVLAVPTPSPDDVPNRSGQHRCPHCRQPLAIISIVIPADAAVVRPPEPPSTAHSSANLDPSPREDDLATPGNFDERQQRLVFAHIGRPTIAAIDAGRVPPFGEMGTDGAVFTLDNLGPAEG